MNTGFITPIAIGTGVVALLALLPLFADGYGVSLSIGVLNYAVLATAWAMFSGPTRYISLATVAFFGVGTYTVAVLGELLPWPLVLAAAGAIGMLLALAIGFSTMRLAGAYFVIFTFGLTELIRQLVTWYEVNVTHTIGRYVFLDITQEQIYWQLLALGAALFLIAFLIERSRLGFKLKVIGGDRPVLRLTPQGRRALKAKAAIPLQLSRPIPKGRAQQLRARRAAGGTVAYTAELWAEGLTPAQIAEAERMARAWLEKRKKK